MLGPVKSKPSEAVLETIPKSTEAMPSTDPILLCPSWSIPRNTGIVIDLDPGPSSNLYLAYRIR
jgi:hypothetical protein